MHELNNKPVYTIGVAAELLGISTQTLQVYEREGLIIPHRTPTNRRRYSDVELVKAENIHKIIHEQGINLAAIRNLLSLIPCWEISGDKYDKCDKCEHRATFLEKGKPCWMKTEKGQNKKNLCRNCTVYQKSIDLYEIKQMIYPEV